MTAALRNEAAAVRERELERYKDHLTKSALSVDLALTRLDNLLSTDDGKPPRSRFAEIMSRGVVDGVIIVDGQGKAIYPNLENGPAIDLIPDGELWGRARRMEFEDRNYLEAAKLYNDVAVSQTNVLFNARARMSQAACLEKLGNQAEAIRVLEGAVNEMDSRPRRTQDLQLVWLTLRLRLLAATADQGSRRFETHLAALKKSLTNYHDIRISSADRVFLSEELASHFTNTTRSAAISGEILALKFLETEPEVSSPGTWSRTELPGIWLRLTSNHRCLALASTERIRELINEAATPLLPPGFQVISDPPDEAPAELSHDGIPVINLSSNLPGWRITLAYAGESPMREAIRRQLKFYRVSGGIVIGMVILLAVVVVRLFREQLRLMRIRNDLVSAVSHELKTPLTSIRVLVDSLRDGRVRDEKHYQRYLELIARENRRLTRLIENFLCFSRMERKQPQFELEPLQLNTIVREAASTMEDRFKSPGCSLNLDLEDSLPEMRGDRDALNTVIVNLLDNAWKYTRDRKEIAIATRRRSDRVVLEVSDNGIGFTSRDAKTLFQPFSQAAGNSNHPSDGCGLGLSIVKFIVEAHNASITAESRPNVGGSAFTIQFPAAAPSDSEDSLQDCPKPRPKEREVFGSKAAQE